MERGSESLDQAAGQVLVQVARKSLERFVREQLLARPDLEQLPPVTRQVRTSFVTLTDDGRLRGCIGDTRARLPLAEDVARHAAAAARDPRFPPVVADELPGIRLEVTVLTPPQSLSFTSYDDLLKKLGSREEGVILSWGAKRAVLLPQVWQRIPDPEQFLAVLARKANIPTHELKRYPPTVVVQTFKAQQFEEPGYREPGS